MRRSTIFLSTAAVLVLSAGWVVGRLSARLPVAIAPVDHGRKSLQDTLSLTPEQDQKMQAINADVKQQMDKYHDRQHSLDKDRDTAIQAMLSPEQSAAYDKILQDYHTHRADLDKELDQCFRSGGERIRAMLTPEQQMKWDAMAKDRRDHDRSRRGGPGGQGGPGRNRGGPSTRPDAINTSTGPV
jgi:Spy/CpxP family protein refolding chaperone